jgi:hypothetical protein
VSARAALLERLGAFYGTEHLALVFTDTNRARGSEDDRPKRVTTPSWQTTEPLPHAARGAALMQSRGQHRNPAINLRTSRLVGIECDGDDDLRRVEQVGLPRTLTEQTSEPAKRHYYFRPPVVDALPKVGFRFEAGTVTADTNRYFICAPALHPSGCTYAFLPELGPGEIEIATLPKSIYAALLQQAEVEDRARAVADQPVQAGGRHEHLRHLSYVMRRYAGASLEAIEAALLAENTTRCNPPKEARLVRALAEYTHIHINPKES